MCMNDFIFIMDFPQKYQKNKTHAHIRTPQRNDDDDVPVDSDSDTVYYCSHLSIANLSNELDWL